ncbi:RnfH family protein [Legionella fairfieldensis]|uniref:RnfH family protein n=1 Tax=Legionella fairfieldensis TaxID=45064 RepID=UPI00049035B3|nr:RnfH family protein [Legionella fairfieldensis]
MLKVELVYIPFDQSLIHLSLELNPGATVADAIEESGLLLTHPEIKELPVGIFSRQVNRDTLLTSGDRIEFYRPLTLDPKEKRRERAKTGRN